MFSFNSGANPNLVQTRLDAIVKEGFDAAEKPGEFRADDSLWLKQEAFDKGAYVWEELEGPGEFTPHAEEQEVEEASPRSGNTTTVTIANYKRDIPIPDEVMEDAQLGAVEYEVRQLGVRARTTRDDRALRGTYGDAFSATTPDAAAICSNSHVALSGDTVDNLETGTLTAANLETVVRSLRRQRAQDGYLGGYTPDGLLVALNLHEDAYEITKSKLAAHTADNQLNYWSEVYPMLRVGTSSFLHSDYNTLNTNVNTSYFVVSNMHVLTRIVRKAFVTKLVPPDTDRKDRWFYKGRFREQVARKSWIGVVGSNGTL